jgi:hypothetical protein
MAKFPAKDVSSWLGNSVPVAMRHYTMATDEAFRTAADPAGQTVTRLSPADDEVGNGGCRGSCIPAISGAISATADATAEAVLAGKSRVLIVQDSAGGYWLMGDEGLEPPTFSV